MLRKGTYVKTFCPLCLHLAYIHSGPQGLGESSLGASVVEPRPFATSATLLSQARRHRRPPPLPRERTERSVAVQQNPEEEWTPVVHESSGQTYFWNERKGAAGAAEIETKVSGLVVQQ